MRILDHDIAAPRSKTRVHNLSKPLIREHIRVLIHQINSITIIIITLLVRGRAQSPSYLKQPLLFIYNLSSSRVAFICPRPDLNYPFYT